MATKPAQICQLQKGKLVDTQKGFVDTFNWAVQSIANLKGGENCDVSWPTDDHPTIDCTAKEGEGGEGGEGGGGGNVDDVSIVPREDDETNDKIKVDYADGTSKEEDIPFDPAIDNISRQWIQGSTRLEEVLSCTYNRGANTLTIPYNFRISSLNGQGVMTYSDVSRVCLSSATDSNVKFNQFPASDGIIL